jgi:hypothetical protein
MIGSQTGTGNVLMQHGEPAGASVRSTGPSASFLVNALELDPWGAEVFSFDPYAGDPQFSGGRGEGGPLFPGVGDISKPSTGCSLMLDGVLTLCEFGHRLQNGGGLQVERRHRDGTVQRLSYDVVLGIARVWHPATSGNSPMTIDDNGDFPVVQTNNSVAGYWEIVMAPIGGLDRMQMWLEEALKYRDCQVALQKLLAQIGSDTNFAPSHTDMLDLFNALKGQTGGGGIFVDVPRTEIDDVIPNESPRQQEPAGGGGLSGFYYTDRSNWRTRQRWSVVFLRGAYSDSQLIAFKRIPYDSLVVLIHEVTHNAPNDFSGTGRQYQHPEMDAAAKELGSTGFDQYVREHCIPERYWRAQK